MNKKALHKILIHSNYNPTSHGGIEFVVSILLKIFSKSHDITCFYGGVKNENLPAINNIRYICRRIILKLGGASFLSWGNFFFISYSLKSNIIIFQEPYPTLWPAILFLRKVLHKNVIILVHASPASKVWIMWFYNKIRAFVFSGSICVTTSPNLLTENDGSSFSKFVVIPLCIPNNSFSYQESLNLTDRFALYIGRLAKYKGIEYILESAKNCPTVNFVIAGDGPLADYIDNFIQVNKIKNIQFINRFVSEDEKYELITRSSFVLFPSISKNEGFGLVQLEAMKSKKAIVNTWINSGVNYVAPNKICAITVSPKNSVELSAAIQMLWNDISLSTTLGHNGFDRFNSLFREELFINAWNSLLDECLREV